MPPYAQDSSHGRLWQQRPPATPGGNSLRPRLLLLAGGWVAGVASSYCYERIWGATEKATTFPHNLEPDRTGTAQAQASSAHATPRQDPNTATSALTTPPQTGAAAVWRGVFNPGETLLGSTVL
jgi:hypothetical protein